MKKESILILHGWGLKGASYRGASRLLEEKGYQVFAIDLPGFGSEPLTNKSMDLTDYVNFVHSFVKKKKLSKIILIGHSFGGRVSLKYCSLFSEDVKKLILTGVPIVRHMTFKKYAAYYATVTFGKVFKLLPEGIVSFLRKILYFAIGEWDYYKADDKREVFKNVINEDLIPYAKQIKIPTLLLWGRDDQLTPSTDVKKIEEMVENSKSAIIEDVGHKLPYAKPEEFVKNIIAFLK